MLEELRVENLLLIERAEVQLGAGLNVITGETGAGKTVLTHALDLLLGGKPRSAIVRPGATEAYVEGIFTLSDNLPQELRQTLAEDADHVVLARRVSSEGRSRAYIGGRSATVADLAEWGSHLLAFYGQHAHRKLTLASAQLDILDSFCGSEQRQLRERCARSHQQVRQLSADYDALELDAGARERELDLLRWELKEIEDAEPTDDEESELLAERDRLRNADELFTAITGAARALCSDEGDGAVSILSGATQAISPAATIDPALGEIAQRLEAVSLEVADLNAELTRYEEQMEADPGRLDVVEQRLALLDRLKRKHGGTIAGVLEFAAHARSRLTDLEQSDTRREEIGAALQEARSQLEDHSRRLRKARAAIQPQLSKAVEAKLAALAMSGATFEVVTRERETPGPLGCDEVEFMLAPNPGVPAGALREIASGGELSRIMLALMSVAAKAGPQTLVFDEIDAGIGGKTARAVGEELRALASAKQLICITHLPQIASLADRHFTIVKQSSEQTSLTTVTQLGPAEVVGEIVRMLGADSRDLAARKHAEELLRAA